MSTTSVNLGTHTLTLCDATSGAFSVYLNSASSDEGKVRRFKKTDSSANAVTIDGNGAETIDGSTTYVLADQNDTVTVVSDGSAWYTIWPAQLVKDSEVIRLRKSADETITNDNTYTTDSDLSVTLAASVTYVVDWAWEWNADATPDIKIRWVLPTNATWDAAAVHMTHNSSSQTGIIYDDAGYLGGPLPGGASDKGLHGKGTLESGDGGTFGIEWAQNTSHANNTTLYEGSYIRLMRV